MVNRKREDAQVRVPCGGRTVRDRHTPLIGLEQESEAIILVHSDARIAGRNGAFACSHCFDRDEQPRQHGRLRHWNVVLAYDALDDLLSVAQGTQQYCQIGSTSYSRCFTYDSLSRLLQAANPESGTVCYGVVSGGACQNNGYDGDGNLVYKTDARGTQNTNSYDALNRPTIRQYSDATGTVYFNYDGNTQTGCSASIPDSYPKGRRTGMCDSLTPTGSEAWSHDPMGRTITDQRTTDGVTEKTVYTYLPYVDGSVDKITYPNTFAIVYTYDGAERPTSATDSNGNTYALGATYAPQGALQTATVDSTSHFAGFSISNSYTKRLQPNEIKVTNGSASVVDFSYCFYALNSSGACPSSGTTDNGNVMGIINNVDNTRSQTFVYDALNRISTAGTVNTSGTNCWGEQYGYDTLGLGNLLKITLPSAYNSSCNQPDSLNIGVNTSTNQINNPSGYVYDLSGNLTTIPNGGGSYTYNAENQITSTAGVNYDGDGKRVEKSNGTLYWYGVSGDPLEETTLSGTLINYYVFFGGQRIARFDSSGNIFAYFADHLGSSREVEEIASGGSSASLSYDADFYPFGRENDFTDSANPIYKFTGKIRDAESGLDDFGARYNTSNLGRFMSPDPLLSSAVPGGPQSWNRYAYALNNPTRIADPTGLWNWDESAGGDLTDADLEDIANDKHNKKHKWAKKALDFRVQFRNAFDDAEEAMGSSLLSDAQQSAAVAAVSAYGTEGDDNGVTVGIESGHGASTLLNNDDSISVKFGSALKGNFLTATVAHEGAHVDQAMTWLYHGEGAIGDINHFAREQTAWTVGSSIAQALGMKSLAPYGGGREHQVWNDGWKAADVQTLRSKGIANILNYMSLKPTDTDTYSSEHHQ